MSEEQLKKTEVVGESASVLANQNPLQKIKVAKVTLNIGAGKNDELLKKGIKLLKMLSPLNPVKTVTKKRIPAWGLRPGLAIGSKVTVRKGARELLLRLLTAKHDGLKAKNFDLQGNLSFGIPEYIDIKGLEYDPELKIMGLEVAVTLEKPGFRVKCRRIKPGRIGKAQRITRSEAMSFVRGLGVNVVE